MTATNATGSNDKGMQEQVAFQARFPHLDHETMRSPWGESMYSHSYVQALYEGFCAGLEVARDRAGMAPAKPVGAADDRDARLWRKWLPWMRQLNRKPFGLAMAISRIDAAALQDGEAL